MRADVLIVGQGLAGTLLGWALERAGIAFAIVDRGHATAATSAAAGLINPITGRRLVKSWRIDEELSAARVVYRELEHELNVPLWHELRLRRLLADERERRIWAEKRAAGELAPFVGAGDESGFAIEGAARVDLGLLLARSRERWRAQGKLSEREIDFTAEAGNFALTIDCRGLVGARKDAFDGVPWEFSKGEVLELAVELPPDFAINRGMWVVAAGKGRALVGATHEPGVVETEPTAAGRAKLEAGARELVGAPFEVVGQRAGVRVTLPDKRPVAGTHPENPRLGVLNGLGAKGALLAPMLARQWGEHIAGGAPFSTEVNVRRFWLGAARPALAQ
jgi:glycine oxidase